MSKAIIYMVLSALAVFMAPGPVSAQDTQSTEPLALVENPPSRAGINPFTKEPTVFAAKPAR